MTLRFIDGNQRVITVDKPMRLVSVSTLVDRVDVTADPNNTGDIYIGGSTVSAVSKDRRGRRLRPGDTATYENVDLFDIWIDAATANDYVFWGGDKNE